MGLPWENEGVGYRRDRVFHSSNVCFFETLLP